MPVSQRPQGNRLPEGLSLSLLGHSLSFISSTPPAAPGFQPTRFLQPLGPQDTAGIVWPVAGAEPQLKGQGPAVPGDKCTAFFPHEKGTCVPWKREKRRREGQGRPRNSYTYPSSRAPVPGSEPDGARKGDAVLILSKLPSLNWMPFRVQRWQNPRPDLCCRPSWDPGPAPSPV